jgi:hypothetical protein
VYEVNADGSRGAEVHASRAQSFYRGLTEIFTIVVETSKTVAS